MDIDEKGHKKTGKLDFQLGGIKNGIGVYFSDSVGKFRGVFVDNRIKPFYYVTATACHFAFGGTCNHCATLFPSPANAFVYEYSMAFE